MIDLEIHQAIHVQVEIIHLVQHEWKTEQTASTLNLKAEMTETPMTMTAEAALALLKLGMSETTHLRTHLLAAKFVETALLLDLKYEMTEIQITQPIAKVTDLGLQMVTPDLEETILLHLHELKYEVMATEL